MKSQQKLMFRALKDSEARYRKLVLKLWKLCQIGILSPNEDGLVRFDSEPMSYELEKLFLAEGLIEIEKEIGQ